MEDKTERYCSLLGRNVSIHSLRCGRIVFEVIPIQNWNQHLGYEDLLGKSCIEINTTWELLINKEISSFASPAAALRSETTLSEVMRGK